jgi:hypothetical protein
VKTSLDKAVARIPACDQVTELKTLAHLSTIRKTLKVIIRLTFRDDESNVGIAAIGGVEAVVKVMQAFPRYQTLRERACATLANLVYCSIDKANTIESGGIQLLLAAVNNHVGSAYLCENVCEALVIIVSDNNEDIVSDNNEDIVSGSNDSTGLLISLGAGAGVDKVSTQWPDHNDMQHQVQKLASRDYVTDIHCCVARPSVSLWPEKPHCCCFDDSLPRSQPPT